MARATSSLPVPLSPGDQHDDVLAGHAADGLVDLAHGRAAADDGVAVVIPGQRLGDDGRLAHQPGQLQGLADHAAELLRIERLEQVVVGPLLHRLDGRVGRGRGGDEDDGDAGIDLADALVDLQPRQIGQAHVEQDHVRRFGVQSLQPVAPLRATSDLDPERAEAHGSPGPGSGQGRRR